MANRKAFTLIEVLISIALMGIVIVALFSSVDLLQNSNEHLLKYVKKSKKVTKATKTLYSDIISSDGNISIKKDEFSRVCMEETRNSLYALPSAKVCWVVLKKDKTLARVEGNNYRLPLRVDDRVEVDLIMKEVSLFDVYHEKDKVLVVLQQEGKEPITFMVQGVSKPEKKKKPVKKPVVAPSRTSGAGTPPPSSTPSTPTAPALPKE
ncbi:MAG: prepilin-type cleavage/methylation domain-containing protein [Epsilonproteobacteria bacterium]|nr:MAG: prepilin-type cleavage/methylation domain-containing protein [Campylobacterota bacterium]